MSKTLSGNRSLGPPSKYQVYTHDYSKIIPKILVYTHYYSWYFGNIRLDYLRDYLYQWLFLDYTNNISLFQITSWYIPRINAGSGDDAKTAVPGEKSAHLRTDFSYWALEQSLRLQDTTLTPGLQTVCGFDIFSIPIPRLRGLCGQFRIKPMAPKIKKSCFEKKKWCF